MHTNPYGTHTDPDAVLGMQDLAFYNLYICPVELLGAPGWKTHRQMPNTSGTVVRHGGGEALAPLDNDVHASTARR